MTQSASIRPENIPAELQALRQWVCWRREVKAGKPTKVPYQVNGRKASTTNPATWNTFAEVLAALPKFDGIGIALAGDLAGIDIDHCIDELGRGSDLAYSIVGRMNSYTEVSPSGTGIRVFFWGKLPPGGRKETGKGVEMYDAERGRYLTVTGWHVESSPATVERRESEAAEIHAEIFPPKNGDTTRKACEPNSLDDQELLAKAQAARNGAGAHFSLLWAGNWKGAGHPSQSEADLELCKMLVFWTGGDASRIDRLFRSSGLMRDKWDRADYRDGTIGEALSKQTKFYTPRKKAGRKDGSMAQPKEPEYIYPDEVLAAVPIGIIDELPQAPARKTSWTADELMTAEFPPPNWSIPEVVPEGLTILGGRPKVGKSWMALQMAWAIGSGGRCLGRQVERGKVLFLAYEDNERRLKDRMRKMGIPAGVSIRFEFSWPRLHKGGLTQLLAELERQPYRLVVIDTIARALAGLRDAESDAVYGSTYDTLQRWALSKGMSILLLDHTRKPSGYASDPVDDIMSTTTKTAISDAILALYKEQGKRGAKLMGRGRDIEDIDWDLNFDSQTACWQVDDSPYTERQSEILQALTLLGKASLTELSKNIGQPKPHTLTRLNILMDSGKVKREMIGRESYFWIAQNA